MIKQRQESIAIYDANGRPELAEGERQEVAVISAYLPTQMSDVDAYRIIRRPASVRLCSRRPRGVRITRGAG